MLEGFFTPPEGAPNCEYQREDDRNADQSEVHIEFDVVTKGQERHDHGDDHCDPGSVVDDDQVLFHG